MKTLYSRIASVLGALGVVSAATLAPVSQAHAVSGADVAAGIILGGIAGAAIGAHSQSRQVVVQQPAVTYPAVTYPVVTQPAPVVASPTNAQCYYPGPPAAYGPCPAGVAVPQAQPQSVYTPVVPASTVVYTQPAPVVYTAPVYGGYYGPSFGFSHRGRHGGYYYRY